LILSLVIHGVVLVIALACSTGKLVKNQEKITVLLSGDDQQGWAVAHGTAGGADTGAHPQYSQEGHRFDEYKRGASLVSPEPLSGPPVKPVLGQEQPKEKTVSAVETYDSPHDDGATARSLIVVSSTGERPSEVESKGDGRVGGGTEGETAGGAGSWLSTDQGFGKGTGDGQSGYLKEQFVYIRDLILKKLTYPLLARERGWEGVVLVFFVIRENGTVEKIRVMKSSGHEVLDEHAIRTVRSVQPFPKPLVKARLIIPIVFSLR
jgi:protein TonB